MPKSIDEMRREGKTPREIGLLLASQDERDLLRRCAVVRMFDEGLLKAVLRRVPTAITEDAVPTDQLLDAVAVEAVHWARGAYRLDARDRAALLLEWKGETAAIALKRLNAELAAYYQKKKDQLEQERNEPEAPGRPTRAELDQDLRGYELESLYHRLRAGSDQSLAEFGAMYMEAEAKYDLARCDDLVSLLEGGGVSQELQDLATQCRARLNARALWADDFYRTGRYLERIRLRKALDGLLKRAIPPTGTHPRPERWVLQLHAGGGSGKTMFLRWAIAWRSVLQQGIPCARIDFDDSTKLKLAQDPSALAAELARQWGKQIAGATGLYTPTGTAEEFPLRPLGYNLSAALPADTPVLLVLDTLEELLIAQRVALVSMLRHVETLRAYCPRLVLILAGRYDLRDRLKDDYGAIGEAAIDMPVRPFDPREARDYLVRLRGLANDDARIGAIINRAGGNPLKLSLHVEILEYEPALTADLIEKDQRVDMAFLIRRVVNHLADVKLRWVLRYGVVPSRLTLEFLTDVMADPLQAEVWKKTTDDPEKGLTDSLKETQPFPRIGPDQHQAQRLELDTLWDELKRFAGSSSWVRTEGDAVIFTPDVLKPMRGLLLEQERTVFLPLHERAHDYFREKAKQASDQGQDPLTWWRQVVFHDFQRRGEEAGDDWRKLVASSGRPEWRRELADEVVSRSCVTDDDPPRPIERADGARMIAPCDLALAYYYLARANVDLARSASGNESDRHWREASDALARLDKFARSRVAVRAADPRIELVRGEIGVHDARALLGRKLETERARGKVMAEDALNALGAAIEDGDKATRISALRARADFLDRLARREAIDDSIKLEALLVRSVTRPPLREVREMRARARLAFDQFREAIADAIKAFHEARKQGTAEDVARLDLLVRTILLRAGRPAKAVSWRKRADGDWKTPPPELSVWDDAYRFVKAESQLALRDPHHALDDHREARKQRRRANRVGGPHANLLPAKPEDREQRARIAIALMDYRRASEEFSKARLEYVALDNGPEADRVLAATIAFALHELGDLSGAATLLADSPAEADPARSEWALRIELLRAEHRERIGQPAEARAIVDRLLDRLRPDAPPRFRALAALTGLSRLLEPTPEPYCAALVDALSAIAPATARIVLLDGLKRCRDPVDLPAPLVKRFLDLLPDPRDPALAPRERGILCLHWAEAMRVVGEPEQADKKLKEASKILLGGRSTSFPLLELLRADDRLGHWEAATTRARAELPRFAEEFKGDQESILCASAWLDQTERALIIWDIPAVNEAIPEVRRRLERQESSWTTHLSARLNQARAELAALLRHHDDANRFRNVALEFYRKLGVPDPMILLPLDAAATIGKTVSAEAHAATTSLLLPLFPIPPAFTVTTHWDYDEGFWVSTAPPPASSHTVVVPDPEILLALGWSLNLTSEGAAPFQAVSMFDRTWQDVAAGLTSLLLAPETLAELDAWVRDTDHPADLRLEIANPGLAPLPWEFLMRPEVEPTFLAGSRAVRHVYRSATIPGAGPVPIKWLQTALRELIDPGLRADGADSSRLRDAIRSVQAQAGLTETGGADAATRWTIDRRLRGQKGDPRRVVILMVSAHWNRNMLARSEMLRQMYVKSDFEVVDINSGWLHEPVFRTVLQGKTPAVVHVAAALAEEPSLGVHFILSLKDRADPDPGGVLTPRSLDELLKSLPETDLKPLVVLDPHRPPARFEIVRQLFLRNAFAAELFRLGNAPLVLATGEHDGIETLDSSIGAVVEAVASGEPIGSIVNRIRRSVPDNSGTPLDDLLHSVGTALFAHDPDSRAPGAGEAISPQVPTREPASTSRAFYALLVGIDDYPSPIPKLRGCVNDINAFANYLNDWAAKSRGVARELWTLKNGEATRQAVIDGFRNHLGRAGEGDVVLFYYGGCGSQEQAPEEFWDLQPDHLDATLVLVDSRQPGSWDLADFELAKLISEVSARGPHVAVILDTCFTGSGTREVGTVVHRLSMDLRRRPIESFLVSPAEVRAASRVVGSDGGGWLASAGRLVLMTACRDDEEAKEYVGDGLVRGAFSFSLGEALKSMAGVPTYRDLIARTSALVSTLVPNQTPQLKATRNDDLDAVFLDGAIQPVPAVFVGKFRDSRWSINGGVMHGIPAPFGSDAARLALFPFDARAADLREPAKAVATARVELVLPSSSRLAIEADAALDTKVIYKALLMSLPTPPLHVLLEGDPAACDLVRKAMDIAGPGGTPSRFICEAAEVVGVATTTSGSPSRFIREAVAGEMPEYRLLARDGRYVITRPGDGRPLVNPLDGLNKARANDAVKRLEHIVRWTQTARLSNPASSIHPDDVKMTVLVDSKEVSGREIRLEYKVKDGEQVEPTFQVNITNNSRRTLYCALLKLTGRYGVFAGLLKDGCVKLEPGETAWGTMGYPIPASVPDEIWKQGVIEYRDLLKLIVCTEELDARLLEQPSLDILRPRATGSTRSNVRNGSLNRLMQKIQTRELGDSDPETIDDWQATEVSFTTVRPMEKSPVPGTGRTTTLAGGITLEGHPDLLASARMSTETLATRDLGKVTLPRLLTDDPSFCIPLASTATQGSDPGLSVLELTDVVNSSAITPEAPLRLTVPVALAANEHVVPVAYDGEFFLPLGHVVMRTATGTTISIDRLPRPLADVRSAGGPVNGAVKIFLEKVISRVDGDDFLYPILSAVDEAPDGTVTSVRDAAEIRKRVSAVRKILLFVHGIIGDAQSMVPSLQLAKLVDGRPLASLYDLVLTFDYESLNTTMMDNGRLLKSRLEAAGLGAGHGKALDVVAHSMGGLVSRWFIEREGGNQIVRRLVMLGTPNGESSPWPTVCDWATVALGLGLNHLTAIAWPASVVGGLAALMETSAVAFNEMFSNVFILTELEGRPEPGIPYVVLAGNTSIIPAATEAQKGGLLRRLLGRLTSPRLLDDVANRFFLAQSNDIAVSAASMERTPFGRRIPWSVRPVACDHLSYFREPAALKALAAVLAEGT